MGIQVPTLSDEYVNQLLDTHYGVSGRLLPLPGEVDQNLLLKTDAGERFIVKILGDAGAASRLAMQNTAMSYLAARGFPVPQVVRSQDGDDIVSITDASKQACLLRVLSYLPGQFYADVPSAAQGSELWESLGGLLGRLDHALTEFDHVVPEELIKWDLANAYMKCRSEQHLLDEHQAALVDHYLESYRLHVLPGMARLPRSYIHNDANDHNLLVDDIEAPSSVIGLIDFGDLMYTHTVNEIAIAAAYAMMGQEDPIATLVSMTAAYHRERPLNDAEIDALFLLVALRLCTSVCNAALEFQLQPENEYLQVSAAPAWALLESLRQYSPFAIARQLRSACGLEADTGRSRDAIIEAREKHMGRTLSLSYQEPLKIVAGQGVLLYDEQGNDYLDMVNNVCHVGHCHPKVVAAGRAQMARLNTNTRFLHDNLLDFAEALLATLPAELSVCMFVNSGSEANELALRLAHNFSQSKELVVVDGAYHGNTSACIDASPYKFDGPGGEGAPDHVHKVMLPDPYRGKFPGNGKDAAGGYASDVGRVVAELAGKGQKPGAYICESLQGVAGQIIMPDGYLQAVYAIIRDAGGVCIADEVQVGFGRVGTHMWAFETQGVVPDIVTLGKPIGNGHPMAAVITTREIADAFVTGMEYFNTFGGNPVSCAIGMAVLDVIRDEHLQENALATGNYLQEKLRELQDEFDLIGDVRGLGLFIGAELVEDRETKTPATEKTAALVEYMKEQGIILSAEGQFHNVLKIKPPIVFNADDADRFMRVLQAGLKFVEKQGSSTLSLRP